MKHKNSNKIGIDDLLTAYNRGLWYIRNKAPEKEKEFENFFDEEKENIEKAMQFSYSVSWGPTVSSSDLGIAIAIGVAYGLKEQIREILQKYNNSVSFLKILDELPKIEKEEPAALNIYVTYSMEALKKGVDSAGVKYYCIIDHFVFVKRKLNSELIKKIEEYYEKGPLYHKVLPFVHTAKIKYSNNPEILRTIEKDEEMLKEDKFGEYAKEIIKSQIYHVNNVLDVLHKIVIDIAKIPEVGRYLAEIYLGGAIFAIRNYDVWKMYLSKEYINLFKEVGKYSIVAAEVFRDESLLVAGRFKEIISNPSLVREIIEAAKERNYMKIREILEQYRSIKKLDVW